MENTEQENTYFEEYENLEVHQLMLQDAPRNVAYKNAIFNNRDFIKGKIVLDVGAGTGILSVFCAQVGASKVYAVEASEFYKVAEEVVKENSLENLIEVIHSKIEDFNLPNNLKVDVIISEWMGFYLLHEGMLDSVLFARDKFLKPNGLMFPEHCTIYCAPCSVPSMFDFWKNINGVSMESVGKRLRFQKSQKPEILQLLPKDLLADEKSIFWIDLKDITSEELQTIYSQEVVATTKAGLYQGACVWFSCQFPAGVGDPVVLSTSPNDDATHWKQTVIVLPNETPVEEGSPIAYEVCLRRSEENDRRYNIDFTMLDPEEVVHPEPCSCHMTKCIIIKKLLEKYECEKVLNN